MNTPVQETPATTPGFRWDQEDHKDPHGLLYDGERAALALGKYTDDELANGAFMNYDRPLDVQAIVDRKEGYYSPITWMTAVKERIRWLSRSLDRQIKINQASGYQARFRAWLVECFGEKIAFDKEHRAYHLAEETVELLQAAGMTEERLHQIVKYVYARPVGDIAQEAGGVYTVLSSFADAHGFDMVEQGELELKRVWLNVDKIREKQKLKPIVTGFDGDDKEEHV